MLRHTFYCFCSLAIILGCNSGGKKKKKKPEDENAVAETSEVKEETEDDKKSNGSNGSGTKPGGNTNSNTTTTSTVDKPSTTLKGGDSWKSATKTKSWNAPETEPEAWDFEYDSTSTVEGLFPKEAPCTYRLTVKAGDDESSMELGCGGLDCPGESNCEESDLDSETIGEFENAKGKRITCVTKLELNDPLSGEDYTLLSKAVSDSWTHDDVLRDGNVAKSVSMVCTTRVASNENADNVDACSDTRQNGTRSMTEDIIESQTEGKGTPELKDWAYASWTSTGDLADPEKSVTSEAICSWSSRGILNVSATKSYCGKESAEYQTFGFKGMDKEGGSKLTAPVFAFSIQGEDFQYHNVNDGDCIYSAKTAEATGLITGSIECKAKLMEKSSSKSATLSNVTFGCYLPDNEPEKNPNPTTTPFGDQTAGTTGGGSTGGSTGGGTTGGGTTGGTTGGGTGGTTGGGSNGGGTGGGTGGNNGGGNSGSVETCSSSPGADPAATYSFPDAWAIRAFVNTFDMYTDIPESGWGTGALYGSDDTANKVCQMKGYDRARDWTRKRWGSPRDNTVARWSDLFDDFLVIPAIGSNRYLTSLVCEGRTAAACE